MKKQYKELLEAMKQCICNVEGKVVIAIDIDMFIELLSSYINIDKEAIKRELIDADK